MSYDTSIIVSGMNQSQIENLDFQKIHPNEIPNLTNEQLGWADTLQLSSLDESQTQAFTNNQLESLTEELLNSINIFYLTEQQIIDLSVSQFSNLSSTRIGNLTEQQVNVLSIEQLNSIDPTKIYQLNIVGLDNNQINELNQNLVEGLNIFQLSGFTESQVGGFSEQFISYLLPEQIPYVPLAFLSPEQLSMFSLSQKSAVIDSQKILLSPEQLAAIELPCLCENTKILTPNGYVRIENLKVGNLVLTDDNREIKIKNILTTTVKGNNLTYPYIIKKHSISENYPPEDCKLSRNHLIKNGENWIHPKLSGLFKVDKSKDMIKYYHIQLENYETDHLVINGGLVVESYTSDSVRDKQIWKNRVKNYHDNKYNIL